MLAIVVLTIGSMWAFLLHLNAVATAPAPAGSAAAVALVHPVSLPSPPAVAVPEREPEPAPETLYVTGKRVPLRSEGRAGSPILDRLAAGQSMTVIERRDEWVRVRHGLTQREGWMQAKRLTDTPPPAQKPPSIAPALSTAAVAKALIAASLAAYPGSCACPYQSDRGGRSCGRRSAYSRPGGYSPLCYASDITPEMVAEYRASH